MILLAGVVMGFFCSCTRNEDITADVSSETRSPMTFRVSVASGLEGELFQPGDEMGVFILPEGGGSEESTENYNTRLVYGDGEWKPDSTLYWLSNETGSRMEVISYYPYRPEAGMELLPLQVKTNQSSGTLHDSDYLWGKTTLTKGMVGEPQSTEMHHLTSTLVFHVQIESENTEFQEVVNFLRVMSYGDDWLDCLTGEVTWKENLRWITPHRQEIPESGDDETYVCRISPQSYENTLFLAFDWADKNFDKRFSCQFEAGKVYQFTLQVTDEPSLVLDSQMPIEEWQEESYHSELSSKYYVGDPWPDADNVQGYVVRVREDNEPGLVIGIPSEQSYSLTVPGNYNELMKRKGEILQQINWQENSGLDNMLAVRTTFGDLSDLPGFDYCDSLGFGWFIPTMNELSLFFYEFFNKEDDLRKQRVEWWKTHISMGTISAFTSTLNFQWRSGVKCLFYFQNDDTYYESYSSVDLIGYSGTILPFRFF